MEDKDEDKDKELVETKHKDLDTLLLSLPPPVCFISIQKVTISGRIESLPSTKLNIYNTNNLYLFQLEEWREQVLLDLLL